MKAFNVAINIIEEEVQQSRLSLDQRFRELPNWSSLTALVVMSRIREQFGVNVHTTDLAKMHTIQDIIDFIDK